MLLSLLLKWGRSSAFLIFDSDIFSSAGMGTNSSVSKAMERNLSNAARRFGEFLVEYPFHFVHILLTDQSVVGIRGGFYVSLKRNTVPLECRRYGDIGTI